MTTERDKRIGSDIGGKYRIVRFLAEGGMGSVYEAFHVVVKRRFAVKFLRADLNQRRDALLRFQREAQAAGALESENIAAAVDFGIAEDGSPYIVMEYLVGRDLAGLIDSEGPLPIQRAADIVLQACAGIKEAHAAGVVHRDLKPENLFLCRRSDGSDLVKILDFGIAKLQASNAGNAVTGTGGIVGTPSYMSPEQASGSTLIDERTDVYALGVILYQLLSGRTPHPGDSYNAIIYHITTQPSLPLVCEGRDFPQGLIDVVERVLSRSPLDRPASAEELSKLLSPYSQREVWPALVIDHDRPLPLDAASAIAHSLHEPSGSTSSIQAKTRRKQPTLTVIAVALLTAMLAGGYIAGRSGGVPPKVDVPTVRAGAVAAASSVPIVTHPDPASNNRSESADAPSATSTDPSAALAYRTLQATPTDSAHEKRPLAASRRPRGRPEGTGTLVQVPPAPKPTASNAVQATFDSRNPYE